MYATRAITMNMHAVFESRQIFRSGFPFENSPGVCPASRCGTCLYRSASLSYPVEAAGVVVDDK